MEYKVILGTLAAVIGLLAFIPYIRDLKLGTTKPHSFTWFVWGLLYAIVFSAQLVEGGGAGAWFIGTEMVVSFGIATFALIKNEVDIVRSDWLCLVIALIGVALWISIGNPLWAVLAAIVAEVFAFAPTYRKSFYKPKQETASAYALVVLAVGLSILALESYALAAWLYPASIIVMNSLFVGLLFVRRKQLHV